MVLPPHLKTLLPKPVHEFCTGALYKKLDRLFLIGQEPEWMFYVLSGEVTLERTGLRGESVILQRTRLGFVSEASLQVAKYHCDAVAISDTQVVKVPVKAISESLKLDPEFSNRWIQMLSSEVKHLRLHCERLSMKSIRDRVLHLIQTEGTGGKYPVMTGLKSLAGELGVTHEALYRTLAALENDQLIKRSSGLLEMKRPDNSKENNGHRKISN